MHEMSLMEGILNRATAALADYDVAKVNSLTVKVGVLANVMPAAFEFAFEALTVDTIFAGAQLKTYALPIKARCGQCQAVFEQAALPLACPKCGQLASEIIDGTAVYLASIDFEEAEEICK